MKFGVHFRAKENRLILQVVLSETAEEDETVIPRDYAPPEERAYF